jgi:uncharacterized protein DUF1841
MQPCEALEGWGPAEGRCDNHAMSPRSRGRPESRGGRRRQDRRPVGGRAARRDVVLVPGNDSASGAGQTAECWFDEPATGDRQSWAMPSGHGLYQGLDLEVLDPADEDELTLLIEAQHPEFADALHSDEQMIVNGEPFSPRLHVAMHQVVASQLLAEHPPETWQTVQRLAGLGYDWHNIMHMIAALVTDDVYRAMTEHWPHSRDEYARRLNELPGDWPPPQAPDPQ